MLRKAGFAFVILLGLAVVAQAAITIGVEAHTLQPNMANQEVDIFVSSPGTPTDVQGVDLNAQVGDGGPPAGGTTVGPTISGDLIGPGTLFNGNNTGDQDVGSFPLMYFHGTTTAAGTQTIPTSNVLLVRLFFNTTGFFAGPSPQTWALELNNTANGPTDFGPIAATITDGSITLAATTSGTVPEPTSVVAWLLLGLCACAYGLRRKRESALRSRA